MPLGTTPHTSQSLGRLTLGMVTPADLPPATETATTKSASYRHNPSPSSEAAYDAGLVQRFNAGDETAFITIMARYRDRLFSVAFTVLKNHGDAEEIAQDAFLCAHRSLVNFRGDSSLSTWLRRIALNLSRNRYWYFHRRFRHASVSLDSTCSEQSRMTFSDLVSTDAANPARDVLIGEFSELIASCMTRLSTPQREILTMHVSLRHSYAEIAQHFGISIGTVKSRIARARERLRLLMCQACPEFNAGEHRLEWFENVRHTGGIEVIDSPQIVRT